MNNVYTKLHFLVFICERCLLGIILLWVASRNVDKHKCVQRRQSCHDNWQPASPRIVVRVPEFVGGSYVSDDALAPGLFKHQLASLSLLFLPWHRDKTS